MTVVRDRKIRTVPKNQSDRKIVTVPSWRKNNKFKIILFSGLSYAWEKSYRSSLSCYRALNNQNLAILFLNYTKYDVLKTWHDLSLNKADKSLSLADKGVCLSLYKTHTSVAIATKTKSYSITLQVEKRCNCCTCIRIIIISLTVEDW